MRSLWPVLIALACPLAMCLPMLLARRRGDGTGSCHERPAQAAVPTEHQKEVHRLRTEVEALRAELAQREAAPVDADEASA